MNYIKESKMTFFSWIRSLFSNDGVVQDTTDMQDIMNEKRDEFPKLGKHEPEVVEPRAEEPRPEVEPKSKPQSTVVEPKVVVEKVCSHCHRSYPKTTTYFNKRSSAPDGFQYICKGCQREHKRKHRKGV
jgi:hypothetical protein